MISFFTTIGNYDYGFYWYLYLDGTIEFEAKATGVVFTSRLSRATDYPYASQLAPGLGAPFHQHLFSARLDMAIDGSDQPRRGGGRRPRPDGRRTTRAATPSPGSGRRCARESEAQRMADHGDRPGLAHQQPGDPEPPGRARRLQAATRRASRRCWPTRTSSIARRAAFATKHLWVTRYDPAERYAAGDFVNQHAGGAGLPAYVASRPGDRRQPTSSSGTPSA